MNGNNVIYFDCFGVEHIPKVIKKFIGNENITNIYRIHSINNVWKLVTCNGFIDFIIKNKILLDYTYSFFPDEYEKNYKIILKYFQ